MEEGIKPRAKCKVCLKDCYEFTKVKGETVCLTCGNIQNEPEYMYGRKLIIMEHLNGE